MRGRSRPGRRQWAAYSGLATGKSLFCHLLWCATVTDSIRKHSNLGELDVESSRTVILTQTLRGVIGLATSGLIGQSEFTLRSRFLLAEINLQRWKTKGQTSVLS